MKCSYCNADLKQGAKFCPKCGREVVICIGCGKPIKLGAAFCPYCGANQHPQQFVQAQKDDNIQSNVEVVPSDMDDTALKIEQEPRSVNATEIQSEEEQEAKHVNTAETPLVEKQESKDSENPTTEEQEVKPSNVVEDQAEIEQEDNAPIEKPKKKSKIIKVIVLVLVIALLLGGGYFLYNYLRNQANQKDRPTDQEIMALNEYLQDLEDVLSYEDFLEIYAEMMTDEWDNYKLPSDYMIKTKHLEVHKWKDPNYPSYFTIVGKNVVLKKDGDIQANGKHAWCICIDGPNESGTFLYLWMADITDIQELIANSEKYGLLETWVESEYDGEPAELTRFAIKNAPNKGVTRVKYEELNNYQTVGMFQYHSKYTVSDNKILLGRYIKRPQKEINNTSTSYNMYGSISEYPITMHLEIDGNQVKGYYYYNRQYDKLGAEAHLTLLGSYSEGHIDMHETDKNGVPTGHFQGNLQNGLFKGDFITNKGDRLQFSLDAR